MNELFGILKATLEEGFVYAILAYGVYITYSILDFPDLSVDGTVPLGAVLTGVLILQGFNPWLCVLFSFVVGALAGCVTGLLNVKLKIRPLLCGIRLHAAANFCGAGDRRRVQICARLVPLHKIRPAASGRGQQ